ncbi:hypothetical protein OXPF_05700 [Oxobacter pfennigii]|uniref:Uncharacterized protein n=1 Tax=Oxobacter pfennigii TaxID=36849 RepID=A0A0P8WD84_9CLOT|nr:hypothetical protein [Oxobacter pfennigii]KPU45845.1 hypothetical protein OXPF_05700 [Oxobacter pfennigii]
MPKYDQKKNSPSANKQEKLKNAVDSIPGDNQNQNHNAKKEALGPNTKQ